MMGPFAPAAVSLLFKFCSSIGAQSLNTVPVEYQLSFLLDTVQDMRQSTAANICHAHTDTGLLVGAVHKSADQFGKRIFCFGGITFHIQVLRKGRQIMTGGHSITIAVALKKSLSCKFQT